MFKNWIMLKCFLNNIHHYLLIIIRLPATMLNALILNVITALWAIDSILNLHFIGWKNEGQWDEIILFSLKLVFIIRWQNSYLSVSEPRSLICRPLYLCKTPLYCLSIPLSFVFEVPSDWAQLSLHDSSCSKVCPNLNPKYPPFALQFHSLTEPCATLVA